MPCSGEEEGRKKERKKRELGAKEGEQESSGRFRGRKEQWSTERRGNCLAKALQHKQETVLIWKQRAGWGGGGVV